MVMRSIRNIVNCKVVTLACCPMNCINRTGRKRIKTGSQHFDLERPGTPATCMQATIWLTTVILLTGMPLGCGTKSQSSQETAENLKKSFEKSDPSVAQEVREASTAFQASNYTQAILIMDRLAQARQMDATQKKA